MTTLLLTIPGRDALAPGWNLFADARHRVFQFRERALRGDQKIAREGAVSEDFLVDGVALVQIDAGTRQILQPQIQIAVQRRLGRPRLEVASPPDVGAEQL